MALGQFQNISVRILDESIDISAAGPIGRGSADEFNAFRFEAFAELITIRRRCVNKSYLPLVNEGVTGDKYDGCDEGHGCQLCHNR